MATRFSISYLEVLRSNETVSSYLDQQHTDITHVGNNSSGSYGNGKRMSYGSINNDSRSWSPSNNLERRGAQEEQEEVENSDIDSSYSLFHKIIEDMVIPKVIDNIGNKVTKMSMTLLDGYDCYYTTMSSANTTFPSTTSSNNDVMIVCFIKLDIPKILPIRVLSELKQHPFNEIDSNIELRVQIGDILDKFHEELINYRNVNLQNNNTHTSATNNKTTNLDDDIQDVIKIMNDNIDKFLERQERVSLLLDKTTKLNNTSHNFKRKATRIKDRLWWQRTRTSILLIFAIVLCLSVLFVFIYIL